MSKFTIALNARFIFKDEQRFVDFVVIFPRFFQKRIVLRFSGGNLNYLLLKYDRFAKLKFADYKISFTLVDMLVILLIS